LEHFRVRQNIFLDRLEARIEKKVAKGISVAKGEKLACVWGSGVFRLSKSFDTGNGEKILKRLLGISKRIGAAVDDAILYEILLRRPGSRTSATWSITSLPLTNSRARLILSIARDAQIVDDATFIHIAQ